MLADSRGCGARISEVHPPFAAIFTQVSPAPLRSPGRARIAAIASARAVAGAQTKDQDRGNSNNEMAMAGAAKEGEL